MGLFRWCLCKFAKKRSDSVFESTLVYSSDVLPGFIHGFLKASGVFVLFGLSGSEIWLFALLSVTWEAFANRNAADPSGHL